MNVKVEDSTLGERKSSGDNVILIVEDKMMEEDTSTPVAGEGDCAINLMSTVLDSCDSNEVCSENNSVVQEHATEKVDDLSKELCCRTVSAEVQSMCDNRDRAESSPPDLCASECRENDSTTSAIISGQDNVGGCHKPTSLPDLLHNNTTEKTNHVDFDPCITPTKQLLSSPGHIMRTPVTENDPLGLFNTPVDILSSSTPTESNTGLDLLNGTDTNNKINTESEKRSSRRNLQIELGKPFGGSSTPLKTDNTNESLECIHSPTNSFGSSNTSSPGSPPEPWSPLSQSQSIPPQLPLSTETKQRAATLPQVERTKSVDSSRKPVSRSESFGSALRTAASMFSTKFTELKQSMGTPSKSDSGSTSSLTITKPEVAEEEKLIETDEDVLLRKAGSLDQIPRPGRGEVTSSSKAPYRGHMAMGRYSPFGRF